MQAYLINDLKNDVSIFKIDSNYANDYSQRF